MKKYFILTILILSLLTGCGRGAKVPNEDKTPNQGNTTNQNTTEETNTNELPQKESLKAKDFFSFEKDLFMDFKGTGNEFAEYKTYVDYVKEDIIQVRNINPGTVSVFVYKYKDGALVKTYSRGETYYLYDYTDEEAEEEIIIKEPIEIGTSWSVDKSSTRSITGLDIEVSTPSGKYKAIEITTENPYSIIKDYYVRDIGKVKSEFVSKEDTNFAVVSELQRLERGKSNTHDINFYFPDLINDRIICSTRNIEFNTNQDIKKVFEDGLKESPPNEDEIKGTLTPNVKILDIDIDDSSGIVTVDFSSELVKEMNAGSSYELMILDSLANTFGDYFQKDKVILTVEGKPYSSGHILMREGEYITVSKEKVK
jgi:predicted small lipoprotein YifL